MNAQVYELMNQVIQNKGDDMRNKMYNILPLACFPKSVIQMQRYGLVSERRKTNLYNNTLYIISCYV